MIHQTEHAQAAKSVHGGELTLEEIVILFGIRDLFQAVAEGRAQFNLVAEAVSAKLLSMIKSSLDLDVLRNVDALVFTKQTGENVPFLPDKRQSVSPVEREFAEDVVGAINFTVRNGVSIGFIVNILSHDLGEVFKHGGLDEAREHGFLPKCHGYRNLTESAVGDVEPDQD